MVKNYFSLPILYGCLAEGKVTSGRFQSELEKLASEFAAATHTASDHYQQRSPRPPAHDGVVRGTFFENQTKFQIYTLCIIMIKFVLSFWSFEICVAIQLWEGGITRLSPDLRVKHRRLYRPFRVISWWMRRSTHIWRHWRSSILIPGEWRWWIRMCGATTAATTTLSVHLIRSNFPIWDQSRPRWSDSESTGSITRWISASPRLPRRPPAL